MHFSRDLEQNHGLCITFLSFNTAAKTMNYADITFSKHEQQQDRPTKTFIVLYINGV